MGKLRHKPLPKAEQFTAVNDVKLRITIQGMADKYSEQARNLIYATYQDDEINSIYRAWRDLGVFQHGSKDKSRRKILEIPNGYVYDFLNTLFVPQYGTNWYDDNRALNHELVRPWWVVAKL